MDFFLFFSKLDENKDRNEWDNVKVPNYDGWIGMDGPKDLLSKVPNDFVCQTMKPPPALRLKIKVTNVFIPKPR